MAGDISVGDDHVARILANTHDEEGAEPGKEPRSALARISDEFVGARVKATKQVIKSKKAVKIVHTIKITETLSFGSGDFARLSAPEVEYDAKMTKPPPIRGRAAWVDIEGNQIGQEPAQTELRLARDDKQSKKKAG